MTDDAGATSHVADTVLSCTSLSKVYHMGEVDVHALEDVDFSLKAGELLVLLGASGSANRRS